MQYEPWVADPIDRLVLVRLKREGVERCGRILWRRSSTDSALT